MSADSGALPYTVELDPEARAQTEETFTVEFADGRRETMRIHDYDRVYSVPGLYEEVVQRRLECRSPETVAGMVLQAARDADLAPADLRVLDLGAGNGVSSDDLAAAGVRTLLAIDNIPEAREAATRDRPGRYDAYIVATLPDLPEGDREAAAARELNCLVCVGALGFSDIPPAAFERALRLLAEPALIGFTIHESFLDDARPEGLGAYVRELADSGRLEIVEQRRFQHRLSTAGTPLRYVAVVGWSRLGQLG
jgi:predicted TPR repeat methyltransferase